MTVLLRRLSHPSLRADAPRQVAARKKHDDRTTTATRRGPCGPRMLHLTASVSTKIFRLGGSFALLVKLHVGAKKSRSPPTLAARRVFRHHDRSRPGGPGRACTASVAPRGRPPQPNQRPCDKQVGTLMTKESFPPARRFALSGLCSRSRRTLGNLDHFLARIYANGVRSSETLSEANPEGGRQMVSRPVIRATIRTGCAKAENGFEGGRKFRTL